MDSNKIVAGIKWAGIQFVLDTFFKFSIKLILAKLLLPNEFGLVGMCSVFIAVAEAASELGMGAALIQKKDEAESMYSTAYWSGIVWGVFLYCFISFIIGPYAAYFYDEPLLIKLIPLLSLGILIKPFSLIHIVILTRKMDFKKIAKIFNISTLISGILAIIVAYFDYGIWALVVNNVLTVGLTVPLLYLSLPWRPKLEWNKKYFKNIFGFGAYSTATSIFSALTYNVDNLIIGKMLGAPLLGSYTLSFSLTEQLRQMISAVLNKVMYPVFGKSQNNKEKLKNYFLKIINFNAIVIYPLMTFLFLFARDIIVGFFGEKWEEAIMPLRILAIAMMIHLLVNSFTSLVRGLGKPELEMKIIIGLTVFILIPGLYVGILYYGLIGAAFAILFNKIALMIIGLKVLNKEIGLPLSKVLIAVKSAITGILFVVSIMFILMYVANIKNIFILAPIYIISYIFIIYKLEKTNLRNIIKQTFNKNS